MTEPGKGADSAGALLRAAREKQGLHIAALAAAIKVTPRKLDALEGNRWDELPDATFTRALAQTVCRTLKIDARPVLDLLPAAGAGRLENVAGTLNTPFSERGNAPSGLVGSAVRPMVWAGAVLLLAALVVYFVPSTFWAEIAGGDRAATVQTPVFPATPASGVGPATPAPELAQNLPAEPPLDASAAGSSAAVAALAGSAADAAAPSPARAAAIGMDGAASMAASAAGPAGSAPGPALATGDDILVQAVQASWVEARDARGRVLISRIVSAGEQLQLSGELPMRLVIGNAAGVELSFRQQRIDLPALTRDNVARLQLP